MKTVIFKLHFVSDSTFKRLPFDYSSSETVSNQKIKKNMNYNLDNYVFLEIRLTRGNQLLPNISRNYGSPGGTFLLITYHLLLTTYYLSRITYNLLLIADVVLLYTLNIFYSRFFFIKIYDILKNNILTCSYWASVES